MTEAGGPNLADDKEKSAPAVPTINLVVEFYSRPDPTLQDLISVANLGAGVAVTLYLPWGVVSGHVEANNEFFASAARSIRGEAENTGDENFASMAEAIAGRTFDPWAARVSEDDRLADAIHQGYDLTTFITLTHVQAFLGDSWNQPLQHEYLRVRLNSVTAWAYGMVRGSVPGE
ncbi:hypothetical protein BN1232_02257 [Mycobacterium lentiflavum]|uniref:Uncharacterized protein n=1 Tax=Mycobacterium lentiflavum TaxID=141349 RepID=A0A0E4GX53_MYCLN|nr:hypothetical protein [Mycobacterium lentiflavum]CQD11957.1 hypothetical protein BN1232_02257 [Mycobacterium lentiflavum]